MPRLVSSTPGLAAFLLLGACLYGGDATAPAAPALVIASPPRGPLVTNGVASLAVPVDFAVSGFELSDECAGAADCGRVALLVDGASCNAPGLPYNAVGTSSPLVASLQDCPRLEGNHQLKLVLLHDDGTPVTGGDGVAVATSTTVTVTGAQ
jgi:hypothetical protein